MKKSLITFYCMVGIVFLTMGQPIQNYSQRFSGFQVLMRGDTSSLELGNSFTLEAWVFIEEYSPYAVVMGKTFNPRSNDPYMNYSLSFDANGNKVEFVHSTGMAGSYRAATSPDTIPLRSWTHIAGTLGAGQMKLYINGTLVATETSSGNTALTTGVPFAIGTGSTHDFQTTCCGVIGAIQQVRVWSQEQSQADIQSNMNSALTGSESVLLAYWPMNDSTGQTIPDITPGAFHLMRGLSANAEGEDPYPVYNEILVNPYFEFSDVALPDLVTSFPSDIVVIDFNSDGNKDFIVTQVPNVQTYPASFAPMQCVKNSGSMMFSLDTIFSGNDSLSAPRDFAVGDFNGDQKNDLFIGDHGTDISPFPGGQNRLFLQNTGGNLVESSSGNIPMVMDFTHNVAVADIEGDGDIDVYVCNLGNQNNTGPRLLINNGLGQFTVNTSNLPLDVVNLSPQYMSSRFADIDHDNDYDLILGAADYSAVSEDLVLINNGLGVFSTSGALPQRYGGASWGTVSVGVLDANNDTWPDLIMSTLYQYQTCQLQLLINEKNGTFSDSTHNIPQNWPTTLSNIWIKMIKTADFNNDGWMDFLICLFDGKPGLYFNAGNTKFVDVSKILGINANFIGYDVGDFDNDGLTDLAFLSTSRKITIAKNLRTYEIPIDSSGVNPGINEPSGKENNSFEVYPNPAGEYCVLYLKNHNQEPLRLRMFDIYGFVAKDEIFDQTTYPINTADLNNGIYIVEIKSKSYTGRQKLIIQK